MRSLVHQHPGVNAKYPPVVSHRHRHVHLHLVGVSADQQVLHPVFDPLHRTVNLPGKKGQDNPLRVSRALDAELSPHVRRYDPDGVLRQPHDVGDSGAHQVRRPARRPHRQPLLPPVVVRDDPPRLHRNPRLPGEAEGLFQFQIGLPESPFQVAPAELAVKHDVIVHTGVNHRRVSLDGLLCSQHHRQRLVLHHHRFGHVLRRVGRLRRHRHDGVAHECHLPRRHREAVIGPGELAGAWRRRPHRVHVGQHFLRRDDADGPRHFHGSRCVYRHDIGVGVVAAHEGREAHPRQLDVVHKPPPPAHHAGQLRAGNLFVRNHRALHSRDVYCCLRKSRHTSIEKPGSK